MLYKNKEICLSDLIINAKFVDGGRGENNEYDCWGLCLEVFRRCGMEIPDYSVVINDLSNPDVISAEDKASITKAINEYKISTFKRLNQPCVPCIVVLRYCLGNYYNHIGVYLGFNRFIHIATDRGCVIENLNSPVWRQRVEGFYFPQKYWSDINANSSNH